MHRKNNKKHQIKNIANTFFTFIKSNIKFFLFLIFLFLLFFLFIYLVVFIFNKYSNKIIFETDSISFSSKNENVIFYIDEILLFSSSNSQNTTSSKSHFTIQNLYQYTDIAFFIKTTTEEKTLNNTLKSLSISNINISNVSTGDTNLYFKSINNFTQPELIETNKIINNIDFEITSEVDADLSSPILYNNLANPITLSYINQNIKTDYTLTDTSVPITYDGSLLERCNIQLSLISAKLSFNINITNNLNEKYVCSVFIDIPLELTDSNNIVTNIYSGNISKTISNKYLFYRL